VPTSKRQVIRSLLSLAAAAVALAASAQALAAEPLTLEQAIRQAWAEHPGLAAGAAQVEAARAQAEAARAGHYPTLGVTARALVTDEPMNAFGLKLDEQRITAPDFDPARLNSPSAIGGIGLGGSVSVPLYAGGRISAGASAAAAGAEAEERSQERRQQELALAVVRAYFGAEVAAEGVTHAEDVLRHAAETERFVRARNAKGLLLDSEVARATAFRAQAEAERATAQQRRESARSGLVLLVGERARGAELTTALGGSASVSRAAESTSLSREAGEGRGGGPSAPGRPDLAAARAQAEAARAGVTAARGSLLPEVFAQGSVETMRSALDQGATWFTAVLGARWNFSLADQRTVSAARARAVSAERALAWQERQAAREVEEAERAIAAADARVRSAEEAVAASESARALRQARHREGLLPLTDVLDAEAGLAGARALLRASRLEARVARAERELALGQTIEGVQP
jgi:outer membrane protein TolC